MARYIFVRALDSIPTIFLVLTLVFIAMRILPGDPAIAVLGENARPETIALFRERFGLNDPIWLQYLHFLRDVVTLDFGTSLMKGVPVGDLILRNIPYTIELTIAAMIIGISGGIPLGVWAAINRNKAPDNGFRVFSLIGYAVPDFYLGAMLLIIFALNLGWFPITGAGVEFTDRLHHIVLPAVTLAMLKIAFLGRLSRTSLLEVMGRDYVRTARAKGAREPRVIYRHGLRNALLPLSTGLGLSVLTTLSGSVAVELVFNRPGIGRLLIDAISERDYPVIQAGVIVFAAAVVIVNLLMEIVYVVVDPRIKVK
ncbi:ABC transporter permease [Chelativorans sp. YIM 93263]|uniref:ABC transporter permease n=1 Tax=Chelativorans sp. YIM 93263 TaxID=2906648 RepID=UPI002378FEFB|nr:ABC transporter permease [Chelativorans sp. YIM 93263]